MELLEHIYGPLGASVAFIVWLTRLESKVKECDKTIVKLEERITLLESVLLKEIKALAIAVARIEGKLEREND